jgi:hypothetical protein
MLVVDLPAEDPDGNVEVKAKLAEMFPCVWSSNQGRDNQSVQSTKRKTANHKYPNQKY